MRVRKRGDLDGGEVGGSEKEVAKLQSQYITFFLKKSISIAGKMLRE